MAKEIILPFSELKGTLDAISNEPTLEITENGLYNVKGYSYADVNVEGGGSSDFSTVEVTITNTTGFTLNVNAIALLDFMGEEGMIADIILRNNQPLLCKPILYKGQQTFTLPENTKASVTGDIIYDSEYDSITITGAGTITISSIED